MGRLTKAASGFGCLVSVVAPLIAVVLYPKARWLFWFALIGVDVIFVNGLLAKDPTPRGLAEEIEKLLTGNCGGWDVDDFEHQHIRDPELRYFHKRSMEIGGAPEDWVRLDDAKQSELRAIIRELRELGEARQRRK